ncbi:tail fiber assembly protein [Morganella morganii]|uniref:tail fiber assembly protein n=1 Tax=Morganella morganii TaxID=582 RepID=UPI00069FB977|nr:tail assembly chaperone [Morganella morganii]
MYKFSAKTIGFYFVGYHTDIPDDAVDITNEHWRELMMGQEDGKKIAANENGYPVLIDRPEPTHEQYIEIAELQKKSLIDAAMQSISVIQLKLQAGRNLTDDEKTRLNEVLDYIEAVTVVDTYTAPVIIRPNFY